MCVRRWGGVRVESVGRGWVWLGLKVIQGLEHLRCVQEKWGAGEQPYDDTFKLIMVRRYLGAFGVGI